MASILDIPCGDFHWLRHVPLDVQALPGRAMALWQLPDLAARVEAALREDLGEGQDDVGEGLERE